MTLFQIIMLAASAFFAFKVYEHIQALQDIEPKSSDSSPSSFDPEALVQRADEAFDGGDLQKALALLIEANAKESQGSDVLFKMGYILQQLGDNSEALRYYKEALEKDKENEYIHNSIASVYRAQKEFVSAKMHLSASIGINDKNALTYYNYGNLLVDMKHLDEAKAMYKKAIELNSDFKEAKDELEKLA
ncbi:MAG: tetratricopeptide repeat protein [Sulfurimonas sp.]|uniref:tetratricopeptide repeat protein n=1 Tax=Sulfurimonas sp. TaxID=2022749 RepID=UPI0026272026|nr:tetratricopeptide repeat protein [Sulfurimonas sp.]MDD5373764.1 tetratricopeptide repeat protein [Sulfurimonas sp.]